MTFKRAFQKIIPMPPLLGQAGKDWLGFGKGFGGRDNLMK